MSMFNILAGGITLGVDHLPHRPGGVSGDHLAWISQQKT